MQQQLIKGRSSHQPMHDADPMTCDRVPDRHHRIARAFDSLAALARRAGSPPKQAILLACVLVSIVVAAVAIGIWVWDQFGYANLDRSGAIALAIGVIATLGLGIGLMGLVFYSSRHGYDEGTKRQ